MDSTKVRPAMAVQQEAEVAKAAVLVGYSVFTGAEFPSQFKMSREARESFGRMRSAAREEGRSQYQHAYTSHSREGDAWRVTITGNRHLYGASFAYCEIDALICLPADGVPLVRQLNVTSNEGRISA